MSDSFSLKITADLKNLAEIYDFVDKTSARLGLELDAIYEVRLAVDEAITNIIVHGYQNKGGSIELEIGSEKDTLVIRLRDEATPFDPTSVLPPDLTKPLIERAVGGMGVHLIRQTMDQIIHRVTSGGGNELTLVKNCTISRRNMED